MKYTEKLVVIPHEKYMQLLKENQAYKETTDIQGENLEENPMSEGYPESLQKTTFGPTHPNTEHFEQRKSGKRNVYDAGDETERNLGEKPNKLCKVDINETGTCSSNFDKSTLLKLMDECSETSSGSSSPTGLTEIDSHTFQSLDEETEILPSEQQVSLKDYPAFGTCNSRKQKECHSDRKEYDLKSIRNWITL